MINKVSVGLLVLLTSNFSFAEPTTDQTQKYITDILNDKEIVTSRIKSENLTTYFKGASFPRQCTLKIRYEATQWTLEKENKYRYSIDFSKDRYVIDGRLNIKNPKGKSSILVQWDSIEIGDDWYQDPKRSYDKKESSLKLLENSWLKNELNISSYYREKLHSAFKHLAKICYKGSDQELF
ncbi:hypothetical protein [Microbulbifer sp. TYP-18]|uniref:hypothetical protein n=1 Tax=Microbulbifer sp. TYP-18 TaxID=3230024 RepID=UPI0034C6714F